MVLWESYGVDLKPNQFQT